MEWLPALMSILREELPNIEVVVRSEQSPDLANALMRGKLDIAFLRREEHASGLVYKLLRREALVVVMPANHKLSARKAIRPSDLVDEILIGVPNSNSPVLRAVTDRYGKQVGIDLTPDHEALNPAVAISLVASTGGVGLLPLYVRNMLPPTLISRPLHGAPPMIDLVLGYSGGQHFAAAQNAAQQDRPAQVSSREAGRGMKDIFALTDPAALRQAPRSTDAEGV